MVSLFEIFETSFPILVFEISARIFREGFFLSKSKFYIFHYLNQMELKLKIFEIKIAMPKSLRSFFFLIPVEISSNS